MQKLNIMKLIKQAVFYICFKSASDLPFLFSFKMVKRVERHANSQHTLKILRRATKI